jgi:hypothetical protein
MQKWEYAFIEYVREQKGFDFRNGVYYWGDDRTITLSIKDRLNKFGREGWEIVSTCGTNAYICWTLKKPLEISTKTAQKKKKVLKT